jgi:hypothetical protein
MFVSGYKPTGLLIFLRTLDDSTFLVWQHVSVREPAVPSPAVAIWRWFLAVLRDSMRLLTAQHPAKSKTEVGLSVTCE